LNKYSDDIADWLLEAGYTTCFFVAGGNIMHLIESFSRKIQMIPVIHEVAATIATDYFNESSSAKGFKNGKALALVTLGPGVTNTLTGVVGAYIDSRELLLLAGQVKSTDLKSKNDRQRGIQEIDGVSIFSSVTKKSILLDKRLGESSFKQIVDYAGQVRKGPVFIEICHDIQGSISSPELDALNFKDLSFEFERLPATHSLIDDEIAQKILNSRRPLILVGGGIPRDKIELLKKLEMFGIPIATTWHGADRISSDSTLYAGRPNFFGQRWANVVFQQSDLILVLGSSLGLQQTGFNLQEFAPLASIYQIDVDPNSAKDIQIPNLKFVHMFAEDFIEQLFANLTSKIYPKRMEWQEWLDFIQEVRSLLPLVEKSTSDNRKFINPFKFIEFLSELSPSNLNFIPCSSGGSYTSAMQVFQQKTGTLMISSRGLGSMGIGLAGAIGVAKSNGNLTWLLEGDGGILQNIQELGTLNQLNLPIKVIVLNNGGYASIRSTQRRYFDGNYVGCDSSTGLGQPNFELLAKAFQLGYLMVTTPTKRKKLESWLLSDQPAIIEVMIDPEQKFHPKVESQLNLDGSMKSSPLHEMFPPLSKELMPKVFRYFLKEVRDR
jgi:acetolactate synthase-1/2/3 large subunit